MIDDVMVMRRNRCEFAVQQMVLDQFDEVFVDFFTRLVSHICWLFISPFYDAQAQVFMFLQIVHGTEEIRLDDGPDIIVVFRKRIQ